ncbi:MAG: FAD-dependent oxidoreductase, partial [Flavobacteriales bacterium]|nr:FAD-dependent oxidoreductase [Flavobacteriales bacterium]
LSNFGRTRVHLIDRAARILPFEDEDVSELVASNLERKGVIVHREVALEHLEHLPDAVRFSLKGKDGKVVAHEAERALLSVGRVPNLEGLGLDLAGVQQDPATGRVVLEGTRT